MLRFKEYSQLVEQEQEESERFNFFFEDFEYFQDNIPSEELIEESADLHETVKQTPEQVLEAHARNHLEPKAGESKEEHEARKNDELSAAKKYFADLDMRTPTELAQGERNSKLRDADEKEFIAKNAATKKLNPNDSIALKKAVRKFQDKQHPLVNGAGPIRFNASNPFSDTSKMEAHKKGSGVAYIDKNGEEPTITGFQMTPGKNVVNDAGKKIVSCPYATQSCEGSGERSSETSLPVDAPCLGVAGQNAMVSVRRAMKSRLNAITNPEHQKHAAVAIANALIEHNKAAAKAAGNDNIGRLHFRPNNTSDVTHLHGIVRAVNDNVDRQNSDKLKDAKPEEKDETGKLKPKFVVHKIKTYAYTSKPLLNHKNSDSDYRVSSLKGPSNTITRNKATETDAQKEKNDKADSERQKNQDDVIHNLLNNGERAGAYGVLGASRFMVNAAKRSGESEEDPRRKVKAFVFHSKKHGIQKFAAHGNDINNYYGRDTGDLRPDDRTADEITDEYGIKGAAKKELTENSEGNKKGRITTTTMTGATSAKIKKSPFVYHVNDRTLDQKTGELHVDAPKEVSDRILDSNISHHLENKNHLALAKSHNDLLENGDHEGAAKIKIALSGAGVKGIVHNKKSGAISHIQGVSMTQFARARSHNIAKNNQHKLLKTLSGLHPQSGLIGSTTKDLEKTTSVVDNAKRNLTKPSINITQHPETGKITHLNGISLK